MVLDHVVGEASRKQQAISGQVWGSPRLRADLRVQGVSATHPCVVQELTEPPPCCRGLCVMFALSHLCSSLYLPMSPVFTVVLFQVVHVSGLLPGP